MNDKYFNAKARDAFRRRGGDPEVTGALAQWAAQAPDNTGVLVAEDGQIMATTVRRHGGEVSPYYVTQVMVDDPDEHHEHHEAGHVAARLSRVTGMKIVHIAAAEVSHGPSPEWIE